LSIVTTGEGPYSLAIDPGGQFLYATNFTPGTISQYRIDGEGRLMLMRTVAAGRAPAAVVVAVVTPGMNPMEEPGGEFVYVANAGSDDISMYQVESDGLRSLGVVPAGDGPEAMVVDPAGDFVYVSNSAANTISMYRIDQQTGVLELQTTVRTGLGPKGLAVVAIPVRE
jgi:6-phosphogluconolactonase